MSDLETAWKTAEQNAWSVYSPNDDLTAGAADASDVSAYDDIAATWMNDTNTGDTTATNTTTTTADSNLVAFAGVSRPSGSRRTWSDFWDGVQDTLGVFGLYPGAGIVPDGINTVISVGRGRWGDAGMNLAAMVPLFGQFSKGGQLLNKGRKLAAKGGSLLAGCPG